MASTNALTSDQQEEAQRLVHNTLAAVLCRSDFQFARLTLVQSRRGWNVQIEHAGTMKNHDVSSCM